MRAPKEGTLITTLCAENNATVIVLNVVTIKIFPGPDFPGGRGVLIA